jgi:hypothetical protein
MYLYILIKIYNAKGDLHVAFSQRKNESPGGELSLNTGTNGLGEKSGSIAPD